MPPFVQHQGTKLQAAAFDYGFAGRRDLQDGWWFMKHRDRYRIAVASLSCRYGDFAAADQGRYQAGIPIYRHEFRLVAGPGHRFSSQNMLLGIRHPGGK